jgi:hypothetical protein
MQIQRLDIRMTGNKADEKLHDFFLAGRVVERWMGD